MFGSFPFSAVTYSATMVEIPNPPAAPWTSLLPNSGTLWEVEAPV